jgi:hypothetical protein
MTPPAGRARSGLGRERGKRLLDGRLRDQDLEALGFVSDAAKLSQEILVASTLTESCKSAPAGDEDVAPG